MLQMKDLYLQIELNSYRSTDKSLDRLGRKQATETGDFDFSISYL
jgi:hypothetical protein